MSETESVVTSITVNGGRVAKHCMAAKCNGLKISGANWSGHLKKNGHPQTQPVKCVGAEC